MDGDGAQYRGLAVRSEIDERKRGPKRKVREHRQANRSVRKPSAYGTRRGGPCFVRAETKSARPFRQTVPLDQCRSFSQCLYQAYAGGSSLADSHEEGRNHQVDVWVNRSWDHSATYADRPTCLPLQCGYGTIGLLIACAISDWLIARFSTLTSSMSPAKYSPQIEFPPRRRGLVDVCIAPIMFWVPT